MNPAANEQQQEEARRETEKNMFSAWARGEETNFGSTNSEWIANDGAASTTVNSTIRNQQEEEDKRREREMYQFSAWAGGEDTNFGPSSNKSWIKSNEDERTVMNQDVNRGSRSSLVKAREQFSAWDRVQGANSRAGSSNRLRILKFLGKGSFGRVFKAHHVETNATVAVKIVATNDSEDKDKICAEINILSRFESPFIARYVESFLESSSEMWIVMEYCQGGSLSDLIQAGLDSGYTIPEPCIRAICASVVLGLEYLHTIANVCHLSIQCNNILLTNDGHVKLSDFGVSANDMTNICNMFTPSLREPHFDGKSYDVWSLGMAVMGMAEGTSPNLRIDHILRIHDKPVDVKFSDAARWSKVMVDFVNLCCPKDPRLRNDLSLLSTHAFVQQEVAALRQLHSGNIGKLRQDNASTASLYSATNKLKNPGFAPVRQFMNEVDARQQAKKDRIAKSVATDSSNASVEQTSGHSSFLRWIGCSLGARTTPEDGPSLQDVIAQHENLCAAVIASYPQGNDANVSPLMAGTSFLQAAEPPRREPLSIEFTAINPYDDDRSDDSEDVASIFRERERETSDMQEIMITRWAVHDSSTDEYKYESDAILAVAQLNYKTFYNLEEVPDIDVIAQTSAGIAGWASCVVDDTGTQANANSEQRISCSEGKSESKALPVPPSRRGKGDAEEDRELRLALLESVGVNIGNDAKQSLVHDTLKTIVEREEVDDDDDDWSVEDNGLVDSHQGRGRFETCVSRLATGSMKYSADCDDSINSTNTEAMSFILLENSSKVAGESNEEERNYDSDLSSIARDLVMDGSEDASKDFSECFVPVSLPSQNDGNSVSTDDWSMF